MFRQFVEAFIPWWIGQLVCLIPADKYSAFAEARDAAILEISGERFKLAIRRDGFAAAAGEGRLEQLPALLAAARDFPQLRLLRVHPGKVLHKTFAFPGTARRNLETLLGFEIDRETPFERSEVYWSHTVVQGGRRSERHRLDVELAIVPRCSADAAIGSARAAGFEPSAIQIGFDTGRTALVWLTDKARWQWLRFPRKHLRLAALAGGLVFVAAAMPFTIQQIQLFMTEREISALEPEAREAAALRLRANRRLAAIAFLGRPQRGSGGALGVIAGLTKTLPDDTYLTSVSLHDRKVTMTGSSESTARLIDLFASSAIFREPQFDSPVLADENDDLEKLTISVMLASAGSP